LKLRDSSRKLFSFLCIKRPNWIGSQWLQTIT